jgi:eukaryotic-like serine/threonine-protein kinase
VDRTKTTRDIDVTVTDVFEGDDGSDQPVRIRGGEGASLTAVGTTIGPFTVVRAIGEGGMGEVFEAQQTEPVRRRVALKLIRTGRYHGALMARFAAERQALALMSHPNIASFLDAGLSEDGQPYFAMEFVPGAPISEHCRDKALSLRQRLELFVQVCRGVEHAHRRGIIHRDLKPSNVLVTEIEGRGVPKIIDFGVAKAVEDPLTDLTLETMAGALLGTPLYMSPEQADPEVQDIDTRADVYSLGALLYEMLTGQLLWEIGDGSIGNLVLLLRAIREDEPLRPSTRIERSGGGADSAPSLPGVEPHDLGRLLRGDLDWIVMKALAKDRSRRYGSASDLADDIERHLRSEPVLARPPSTAYTLGRFVRRHRAGVAAVAVAIVALLAGTIAATVGFVRATEAEALARQEAERARDAEVVARQEAEAAEQVTSFMVDLFKTPDPKLARGDSVTAREILDIASSGVHEELADQPVVQARLMEVMGKSYNNLGLYEPSAGLTRQAYEQRLELLGADHPDTLESGTSLGLLLLRMGDFDEAETVLLATSATQRRVLGVDDPATLNTLNNLATLYGRSSRMMEAKAILLEVYDGQRRVLGPEDPATLRTQNNLGNVLRWEGAYEEALPLWEENLRLKREVMGEDHPQTITALVNTAELYRLMDRPDDALPLLAEALATRQRNLGDDHIDTLNTRAVMADTLTGAGRTAEAGPIYDDILARQIAGRGADHPFTGNLHRRHATYLVAVGENERAKAAIARFMEIERATIGDDDPRTLFSMARGRAILGDRQGAVEQLRLAAEAGKPPTARLLRDENFRALRQFPPFVALLTEYGVEVPPSD